MGGDQAVIVAGIGFRSGCTPDAIVRLVREASCRAGCLPVRLAAPWFKSAAPVLRAAATTLDLPLILVDPRDMHDAQPRTATISTAALRATGFASVAEAAALAAAGPTATLLLARITGDGASCALAATP